MQPIPSTGAKFQITKGGGEHPVWSPDGREIYFDRDNRLFSVTVKTGPTVTGGDAMSLPITGFVQGAGRRQFDITAGNGYSALRSLLAASDGQTGNWTGGTVRHATVRAIAEGWPTIRSE